MHKSRFIRHTAIMTAVNLIMKSVGVSFNAYLTAKTGSSGMGLFQLVMTVYSLASTFSSAGIRLASTRVSVEADTLGKNDLSKTVTLCITYSGICGCIAGFILFTFSDFISLRWIGETQTALPLRILSLSLPFVAMSSALGGYFTAVEKIPQYSSVQMVEQIFKICVTVYLLNMDNGCVNPCVAIVLAVTAAEIFSFSLSYFLKIRTVPDKTDKKRFEIKKLLRIAIPDAAGTCARSVLLTVEHLLIPRGLKKSGSNSEAALAAYGNIHALALPVLLYPSAILSSVSALLIPDIAKMKDLDKTEEINRTAEKSLIISFAFSIVCSVFFVLFAPFISKAVYKTSEAVKYLRILSPLVPVMYMDMVTDGILKGLDQQLYSMRYNIADSALCVALVYMILPKYSVKGYIFILYTSEILNFYFSFGRLIKICNIRWLPAPSADNSRLFRWTKCSGVPEAYGYRSYRDREKHSQAR